MPSGVKVVFDEGSSLVIEHVTVAQLWETRQEAAVGQFLFVDNGTDPVIINIAHILCIGETEET